MEHYPFQEGKAGSLRDSHKTARATDYLLADAEIVTLARQVLKSDAYDEAERTATELTGNKSEKAAAKRRLLSLVNPPPKRPIYYAQHELEYLPRWTRDALRYLGDYVDMMVKAAAYDKTLNKRVFTSSFGPAINVFRENWPSQGILVGFLERYNKFLYRPAKHEFRLPPGRTQHRFTAREVVLSAYVSMQLGDELAKLSKVAAAVRADKECI